MRVTGVLYWSALIDIDLASGGAESTSSVPQSTTATSVTSSSTTTTSAASTLTSVAASATSKVLDVGAIVGGVVGGIAIVIASASFLIAFLLLRRHKLEQLEVRESQRGTGIGKNNTRSILDAD